MAECDKCRELKTRIYDLEKELGYLIDVRDISKIKSVLKLTRMQSQVILRLYNANGKPIKALSLLERISPSWEVQDEINIKVFIHLIRRRLGKDFIETHHRYGYALPSKSRDRVREILAAEM